MKDQRKTEIRVGLILIAGVLIFLWILGWAKNFSFVSNEVYTTVIFDNVAGLEIGDNVTINGVREGYVKDIVINGAKVHVTLSLNKSVELKQDATFAVAMLDLMGGKRIEIHPGNSPDKFDFSKQHKGEFYSDIPSVMSMVGNIEEELNSTMKDIKITLSALNNYLTDEKLNSDVKRSIANMSEVTEKLKVILTQNSSDIRNLVKNSNELVSDTKDLIKNNKENISNSLSSLNSVLQKADSLLQYANNLAGETNQQKNNLGKILYDKEFYTNLNQSLKQLKELTAILIGALKDEGIKVDAHISIF